ncbi:MAG: PAS domain S-box protein, partial [Deltaproteobacteria bacterium]|nr:PAS domain S-box protein [Deltaproteobacteria bacterium]
MLSRKFVINMVGVVVGLGLSICIGTIILLYQAMVDGQSRQMLEEAQGYSRLVYSMVRFGSLHTEKFKKDEMEAALTQLEAAQQETNSEGGLYSLARRQGDSILYLVRNNHGRISRNLRVPWDAPYAEPSRRGLSGQTGVVSWKDETGEPILAAYVAIPKLDAVMVVGVNLWVIRAPFVRAALLVAGGTAAGVGLALWVFLYSNRRYLQKVAREESSNRAVGDTSADGVIFINEQGRVLSCNPSAITIFGYSLRELVGNNVNMLMPEPYRSQHDGYLQKYRATGKASIIGVGRQVMGQRKDGTTFPAHLGVSEMWIGEERQFVGVLQDLTLQMVAEDEKNRYLRILGAVRRMQDQFISPHSRPREVFDEALLYLLDLTQSEYGFIGEVLHTPQGAPYLKIYALSNIAWNEDTRKFFDVNAPLGLEFHNLNTLFGHTLTTGQPVIANQPAGDPRSGGLPPGHPPMTAYLGIPFIQGGELVGMAGLANKPGGYSQDLLDYLTPMTGACANIVVAYHTQRQKERITEELRLNQEVLSRSQQVAKLGSWMRDMKTGRGVASGEFKKIVEMNGPGEDGEDFFQ